MTREAEEIIRLLKELAVKSQAAWKAKWDKKLADLEDNTND